MSKIYTSADQLIGHTPLLELPKKWMAKNPAVNLTLSVTGTVLAAGLLIVSSILMVDATNTPFLYTKF